MPKELHVFNTKLLRNKLPENVQIEYQLQANMHDRAASGINPKFSGISLF